MIRTQDKMEKLLLSAEEKEEDIEEDHGEDTEKEEGDEDEVDGEEDGEEERDGRGANGKDEEPTARASDETQKNPSPAQSKDKKQDGVLNLNNEVVKMRKEVKRVRAVIIRKLIRQIGALKKKKGNEMAVERNQRRAARLLEEIQAMKGLSPDLVTKTALQKNLSFDQVCKNPKSTLSDRAVARIATHPQFNKKIEVIKAAVKAFKEDRMKGRKEVGKEKVPNKVEKVNPHSSDKSVERAGDKDDKEEEVTMQLKEMVDNEEGDGILKDSKDSAVAKPETDTGIAAPSDEAADVQQKEIPKSKSLRLASTKSIKVKDTVKNEPVKNEPQRTDAGKTPDPEVLKKREVEEQESDLESSDEEDKQYFDDSTEERFHKQSSQSEESEDDFFVGKVNKFKKTKNKGVEGEKKVEKEDVKTSDKFQSELDELESRLKSKATSLQSIYCSSLSGSKQRAGRGRGRGGDTFMGSGLNREFNKQSKFQKQVTESDRNSGSKYNNPCPEGRRGESQEKGFASTSRGRGRGRGNIRGQKGHMGQGSFSQQAPQQALHPSWEASKKRKEQQGQILAFQGKKIKFDDDD
ncbi:hypothetical protein F2P81_001263 [Scophthalmus maximus]|uniref:Serum response factor-binding protein 1 n=2 Tax=Scophthalmus maximus TaxID=52904 RepID=A0A6A4TVC4_SCOMX|nr:hypothetical protein F2P81_001263 [Scophthalmus maximus]